MAQTANTANVALQQVYYKMRQYRTELLPDTTLTETRIHDGRNATFLQPLMQASYRVTPWLALSAGGGIQFFMGKRRDYLDDMNPFIGQVGLHFLVSRRPTPSP